MKNALFLITALFTIATAHAQVEFSKIVPPSPNVASLFKSTITPVNEYSGLPTVSIPLFTVSEGDIQVPISISYHTGGIQVNEESGVVGLGWALNAGGAITRTINGLDDFMDIKGFLSGSDYLTTSPYANTLLPDPILTTGNFFNPETSPFVNADSNCYFPVDNGNSTAHFEMPAGPEEQYLDLMPDTFHYNFNGYSGTFVFDSAGNPVLMEKEGIKILLNSAATDKYINTTFTIITEDGTTYEFNQRAVTSFPDGNLPSDYTSSWFLTKITDSALNEVTFEYMYEDPLNGTLPISEPFRSYTQTYEVPTDSNEPSSPTYKHINGPRTINEDVFVSRIILNNGEVRFNYSADPNDPLLPDGEKRQDMKSYYLKSVELVDNHERQIRNFDLVYSYFGLDYSSTFDYTDISITKGDFGQEIGALNPQYPHLNKRLRLDNIVENGIKKHSFDYFDEFNTIPNKTTFSQDYWGFYNYAPNYESFIPEIRNPSGDPLNFTQPYVANRLPDEKFAKIFSLKEITYPTGGSSEFEYELNTFEAGGNVNTPPPTFVPKNEDVYVNEAVSHAELTIHPNPNRTLYIDYTFTIRGWDLSATPTKPSLNFQNNDFYLVVKDSNGNPIDFVRKITPSSEAQDLWNAYDPTGPNAANPPIKYTYSQQYNNLTDTEYVLEAHFNSQNGLIYGLFTIQARWEDELVSEVEQYSIGGGLRVKSIAHKDSPNSIATKQNYNYHYKQLVEGDSVTFSYGKLKTLPNYYTNHRVVNYLKVITNSFATARIYQEAFLPTIVGKATSHNAFSKDAGSYVGYDQVEITTENGAGKNGKTIKYFHNLDESFRAYTAVPYVDDFYQFPPLRVPHNGLLLKEETYKKEGPIYKMVKESAPKYTINGVDADSFTLYDLYQNPDYVLSGARELPLSIPNVTGWALYDCDNFKIQLYPHYSNLIQQTGLIQKEYNEDEGTPVVTTHQYFYENNLQHFERTKSVITESDGDLIETKVVYPDDIASASALAEGGVLETYNLIEQLKSTFEHRISTPVQTVVKNNGSVLSIERNEFKLDDGIILPGITQTSKKDLQLQDRLHYEEYVNGKPVQLRKDDGTSVVYIWGYNNEYPIAKIEDATYSQVTSYIANLEILSGADDDRTIDTTDVNGARVYIGAEGDLRQALDGLRSNLPGAMLTSYTYDPLIGVTSITDPRGRTIYYEYDALNRLRSIKDHDGFYLNDYKYHYIGQAGN